MSIIPLMVFFLEIELQKGLVHAHQVMARHWKIHLTITAEAHRTGGQLFTCP